MAADATVPVRTQTSSFWGKWKAQVVTSLRSCLPYYLSLPNFPRTLPQVGRDLLCIHSSPINLSREEHVRTEPGSLPPILLSH